MRLPFLAIILATCVATASAADNELTPAEKKDGWTLLFDGKTLNGWRTYANKAPGGWEVVDGTLHAIAKVKGAELITEKKYDNFEFSWEWKLPTAGNNGVKYFVTEERKSAIRQTASFYAVLPPAADKPYREPGEWNQSKIIVQGNKVEHWLNGKNVLTYETGSEAVKTGIAASKFAKEPGFGDKVPGHIMLTYHQDDCWYKNLKIRELK